MQRPVSYKHLYRFTPFEMRNDPNANIENIQFWVSEALSDALGVAPKDIGYLSTNFVMDIKTGEVSLNMLFRADDCITYKRNDATGRALPKIDPLFKNLSGKFFFGKVEESADLGTQTVRHYKKTKKGEYKENRTERENDIDVLIIHANPILFFCYLLDFSPDCPNLEIRYSALQEKELAQPEEYTSEVPCRVNVVVGIGDKFDPDATEENLYAVLKLQEQMSVIGKQQQKAIVEAGERAYEAEVASKTKKKKKHGNKGRTRGDGSAEGKNTRGVGKL